MIQNFCDDLNVYIQDNFQYKKQPAYVHLDTINVKRKKIELYIRFKPDSLLWKNDTIVLARIGFETQRKGNGHNLLSFLVSQAQKYDYQKIGIEQTNEKARSFAEKYGFKNAMEYEHWIASVEDLKNELNSYNG